MVTSWSYGEWGSLVYPPKVSFSGTEIQCLNHPAHALVPLFWEPLPLVHAPGFLLFWKLFLESLLLLTLPPPESSCDPSDPHWGACALESLRRLSLSLEHIPPWDLEPHPAAASALASVSAGPGRVPCRTASSLGAECAPSDVSAPARARAP